MIVDVDKKHLKDLAELYEELSGKRTDLVKMEEQYEYMKKNKSYILAGEEEEGKLVGTIMAVECYDLSEDCKPFMVIDNIVVTEKVRGKGVGRRLMNYCEQQAKKRGCGFIILVSAGHRKEAHAFYEYLGYNGTGAVGFKKYI